MCQGVVVLAELFPNVDVDFLHKIIDFLCIDRKAKLMSSYLS